MVWSTIGIWSIHCNLLCVTLEGAKVLEAESSISAVMDFSPDRKVAAISHALQTMMCLALKNLTKRQPRFETEQVNVTVRLGLLAAGDSCLS